MERTDSHQTSTMRHLAMGRRNYSAIMASMISSKPVLLPYSWDQPISSQTRTIRLCCCVVRRVPAQLAFAAPFFKIA